MGRSQDSAQRFIRTRLDAAACGDARALYELGLAYAVGDHGLDVDLIEAHKWFNLAALNGFDSAQEDRAEVAAEMSAPEIAAAQRAARDWLAVVRPRIAA